MTDENVVGAPFGNIDTHDRGPVFVGGEFDLAAAEYWAPDDDPPETTNIQKTVNVLDCKTSLEPSEDRINKWKAKQKRKGNDAAASFTDEEVCEAIRKKYIEGYLPQLAAYAYALEIPATDEFCNDYETAETVWPPMEAARRKTRKKELLAHSVDRVSILQFAVEKNMDSYSEWDGKTDVDKFCFTAAPHYMDRTPEDLGVESWEDFLRPKVQKICDIIVEPKPPPARKECDDYQAAAEYNDLVETP